MSDKKSFKTNNPAMEFINAHTDNTHSTDNKHIIPNAKLKKQSEPLQSRVEAMKPIEEERKKKRLNLLLQPSVFADISKVATMKKTSVNDLINSILKDTIKQEINIIEKYNNTFD